MILIYLHGFNSSGNGDTALKLKGVYGEHLIAPDYDYIDPNKAFKKIDHVLRECFAKKLEPILIGTSLGGFWANHFAEKYDIKCVLVNPALNPNTSLRKYLGENINFATKAKVILSESYLNEYVQYQSKTDKTSIMKIVLLGEKDLVVDHKKTAIFLKEHKVVINKNMAHRIDEVTQLVSLIDETVYSYTEEILEESGLLTERVVNLGPSNRTAKVAYANDVWALLHKSYEKIGGLAGNGFGSKEEMMDKIPFWKLVKRDGKIVATALYKDKNGRKSVAVATDGTPEGKQALAMIKREDLAQKRSYSEISGPMLAFTMKQLGEEEFIREVIPYSEVGKIIDDFIQHPPTDDAEVIKYPSLKNYFYQREIGGHWKTKLMIGTPGNTIH